MKVLCDVHIPYKLVRFFKEKGLEAVHVNELPDKWFTKDHVISRFADDRALQLFLKMLILRTAIFSKIHRFV